MSFRRVKAALFPIAVAVVTVGAGVTEQRAHARTQTQVIGPAWAQSMADSFKVPEPPGRVRVIALPCPGDPEAQGCHSAGETVDTVFLNPEKGGTALETLAHEMGHVFESYMWNLQWRERVGFVPTHFRAIARHLGLPDSRAMLNTKVWSERFAEGYGLCARHEQIESDVATGYWGFEVTPTEHAAICALIIQLSGRYEIAQAGLRRQAYSGVTVNARLSFRVQSFRSPRVRVRAALRP